jgi:hypothetical protein
LCSDRNRRQAVLDAYVGRPTSAGRPRAPASTDDTPAPADSGASADNGVHPAWWHDVDRQAAASSAQPASTSGAAHKAQPRLAYSKHAPVADPTKNGASFHSDLICCSAVFECFFRALWFDQLFHMICPRKMNNFGFCD